MDRLLWMLTVAMQAFAAPGDWREALVEVTINGDRQPQWAVVFISSEGIMHAQAADAAQWGLSFLASESSPYVVLNRRPGITAAFDERRSRLDLTIQPSLLQPHTITAERSGSTPQRFPLGAFLNYDAGAERIEDLTSLSALTELGVFRGALSGNSTWIGSTLDERSPWVRLDTAFIADFPQNRTSLRIGDSIAQTSPDGSAARFAGLSWGTDFATVPELVTVPMPTIRGENGAQSSIDVLVNGSLEQRIVMPAGPFAIENVPVPSGPGELTYTVRDALGREQIVRQRYYVSPRLLRKDLGTWGVRLGARRQDFGLRSDAYSGRVASLAFSRGLSDRLTREWRVDYDETTTSLGARLTGAADDWGIWTSAAACGAGSNRAGCWLSVGLQQSSYRFGYGLDLSHATTDYGSSAADRFNVVPRWRAVSQFSLNVSRSYSLALAGTWRRETTGERTAYTALSAGGSMLELGHLNFVYARAFGENGSSFVLAQITRRIGEHTSGTRITRSGDEFGASMDLERNAPAGAGVGYYVSAGEDRGAQLDAGATWNGERQTAAISTQHRDEQTNLRGAASGSLVWLGRSVSFARRIDQSFAIAHAAGASGMPVFRDGQHVATTDAQGFAIVPGLRSFETNVIRVDSTALPLTYEVPSTEFAAVPYRRGGLLIDIPVRATALIRLVRSDGTALPAGAQVRMGGEPATAVGMGGIAFLTGRPGSHELRVTWSRGSCHATVRLPSPDPAAEVDVRCDPSI